MQQSWAIVQQKHAQLQCGDSVNLKLHLFQSILVPTFHYGCQVWAMHSPTDRAANTARKHLDLEQKYLFDLKRVCGVPSTTRHQVILVELNWSSPKSFGWKQSIQFWNSLESASDSSSHKTVLFDNIHDIALTHLKCLEGMTGESHGSLSQVLTCLEDSGAVFSPEPPAEGSMYFSYCTLLLSVTQKLHSNRLELYRLCS